MVDFDKIQWAAELDEALKCYLSKDFNIASCDKETLGLIIQAMVIIVEQKQFLNANYYEYKRSIPLLSFIYKTRFGNKEEKLFILEHILNLEE